jgi:prefoldin subunit 5
MSDTNALMDDDKNSLGIPKAIFLEDVDKFMKEDSKTAEDVLKKLDELYQKYRLMEINLLQKRDKLKSQIPDIKMSLGKTQWPPTRLLANWNTFVLLRGLKDMVLQVKKNNEDGKTVETDFILSHNLYAKALVPPTDKVCLWLGANVMLEYDVNEADELLTNNYNQANASLEQILKDLDFLK